MPSFEIRLDGDDLDRLFKGLADDVDAAVRPAAQAGAQVLYDAVKRNVQRVGRNSGALANSIYQAYSKEESGEGRAEYHIGWNRKKAFYGYFIEYGYFMRYATYIGKDGKWHTDKSKPLKSPVQVAAKPFLRPAMAQFGQAQDAMEKELLARIARRSE